MVQFLFFLSLCQMIGVLFVSFIKLCEVDCFNLNFKVGRTIDCTFIYW